MQRGKNYTATTSAEETVHHGILLISVLGSEKKRKKVAHVELHSYTCS